LYAIDCCAKIFLQLDRYDSTFGMVIAGAAGMTLDQIYTHSGSFDEQGEELAVGITINEVIAVDSDTEEKKRPAKGTLVQHQSQGQPQQRRRVTRRRQDSVEDDRPKRRARSSAATNVMKTKPSCTASTINAPATTTAMTKYLEDFNAKEVSKLIANKGEAFKGLARKLEMADWHGRPVVEELEKGDGHVTELFSRVGSLEDELCLISVIGDLKRVSRKFSSVLE
jgi:hypothetical protein